MKCADFPVADGALDDPEQRIDWKAAADFNQFFYALVERVADQADAPAWKPGSKLRPAAK